MNVKSRFIVETTIEDGFRTVILFTSKEDSDKLISIFSEVTTDELALVIPVIENDLEYFRWIVEGDWLVKTLFKMNVWLAKSLFKKLKREKYVNYTRTR